MGWRSVRYSVRLHVYVQFVRDELVPCTSINDDSLKRDVAANKLCLLTGVNVLRAFPEVGQSATYFPVGSTAARVRIALLSCSFVETDVCRVHSDVMEGLKRERINSLVSRRSGTLWTNVVYERQ